MQNGRKASAKGGSRSRIKPVAHKLISSKMIPAKIGDGELRYRALIFVLSKVKIITTLIPLL